MKLYYAYYTQDFKNMTSDIFSWFRDDDKHYLDAAVVINFIEMSQRKKKSIFTSMVLTKFFIIYKIIISQIIISLFIIICITPTTILQHFINEQ